MTSKPPTDRVVSATVRGSSSDRAGSADQNAVAVRDDRRVGATIVAIAGAHGRTRGPRSHVGARIAADVGATKAEAAVAALPSTDAAALAALGDVLAGRIAEQWHAQVRDHVASQPTGAADEETDPLSAYATALLIVIVTPAALLALQLGDGDIVLRGDDGEILRPVANDQAVDSNDADSLALQDAQARFRHAAIDRTARDFALVLVASGLDSANADPEWRAMFTADVMAQAEEDGIDSVPDRIAGAARVDDDDVTVALVFPAAAAAPVMVPVEDATDPRLAATMAQPAVAAAAATTAFPAAATSSLPAVAASTNAHRRRRWLMAAAAAGVVLLAIAAVVALSHDNGSTAPDTTVTTTPATTHAPTTAATSPTTGSGPTTAPSTTPTTAAPTSAPTTGAPATTVPAVVTVPRTTAPPRTTPTTRPPAATTTAPPRTTVPTTLSSTPTT